jgi:hypothetical protein
MKPSAYWPALAALALLGACDKPAEQAATPPGALAPQWEIPIQYQGEWREKLAACGDAGNLTRLILTRDRMTFGPNSGPVQASSVYGPHLTVVSDLKDGPEKPKEGFSSQRVLTFDMSPDQSQLSIDLAENPITLVRCPAQASG